MSTLRSNTLARRLVDRKKGTLYPKGSDGLCSVKDCRDIAEWYLDNVGLRCKKHVSPISYSMPPGMPAAEMNFHRLPHIVNKEDGKLYVRCLFCYREWRPLSFDLPKEDRDYGRIPNKCMVENCRATILTLVGKKPRFSRGSRPDGFKRVKT